MPEGILVISKTDFNKQDPLVKFSMYISSAESFFPRNINTIPLKFYLILK